MSLCGIFGYALANPVHISEQRHCADVSLLCGLLNPLNYFSNILFNTTPVSIKKRKTILRVRITLVCCLFEPLKRLSWIFRNTIAVVNVRVGESILLDEVSRERASAELKQRASELEQAYISGAGDGSDELDCAPLFGSVRAEYGRIVNTHSLSDL